MRTQRAALFATLLMLSVCCVRSATAQAAASSTASAPATDAVLHASDLEKIIPASVFFRGQSAPVQLRNSGGVRFAGGALLFATNVDTSGYSSGLQEKYQAYLVTEVAVAFGDHTLAPGAYGVGFIADNKFVVMDLGGNDLFTATSQRDEVLHRPTPLQVMAGSSAHSYRLYSGRTFVEFSRAASNTTPAAH